MSLLSNIDTGTATIIDKDVIGATYAVMDSGIYPMFVREAFLKTAASGAVGVSLTLSENQDNTGKQLQKDIYISSGTKKGGKSFYIDPNGNPQPLPGYVIIDSLCEILTGKKLKSMKETPMAVQQYDREAGKRITTQVPMLKELLGKPVFVAVEKQLVDKQTRQNDGSYKPNGESRDENEIMKFFRAKDRLSISEILAKETDPVFFKKTAEALKDKVRDRRTKVALPSGESANSSTAMFD